MRASRSRGQTLGGERVAGEQDRARDVAPGGRGGETERAEHAGGARAEDAGDAELACQRGGVQRARAAEGHEREPARVDPALDGHQAQRTQHLGLGDADDALRAREQVEVELAGEPRHGALGGGALEREAARQRRVLEQAAEQQVGVGDRRRSARARSRRGRGRRPPRPAPRAGRRRGRARRSSRRPRRRCGCRAPAARAAVRRSRDRPSRRRSESSIRQTSQDVPPMSKHSTSLWPASSASSSAPPTPPAGPERTVSAAWAAARPESVRPPEDCMICGSGRPRACGLRGESAAGRSRAAARAPRRAPSWPCARTRGTCRPAQQESETWTCGRSSAISSPSSSSWDGWA